MHALPRMAPPPPLEPRQILVIAVLMRGVMRRTFNVYQWEALLLLVAGITGAWGWALLGVWPIALLLLPLPYWASCG